MNEEAPPEPKHRSHSGKAPDNITGAEGRRVGK